MPRLVLVLAALMVALPGAALAHPGDTSSATPVAKYGYSPSQPAVGQPVTFDASESACPLCTYAWEDDGPDGPGMTQWQLGTGKVLRFTFSGTGTKSIRLTITDSRGRKASIVKTISVAPNPVPAPPPPPAPAPPPPPSTPPPGPGQPSCEPGAEQATTAGQVRSAVQAGRNVCVTTSVGNVNLDNLTGTAGRYIGTTGSGAMGAISLNGSSRITIRSRFRSTTIRGSSFITIERSIIGGTPNNRVFDQLIFMPDTNNDVTIQDNDIGWTDADNSGNTGYGCRCYGTNNRLKFVRNRVHDIAADGFQGVGGSDVLIDRNEIGPVGAGPNSNEHSDNIQITGNGPNLRITNNWIHHQGYYNGNVTGNAGATYIHGGSTGSLLYENNLIQVARGRVEFGGLGTGGTSRSNLTVRRNTFYDLGQAFSGFAGMEWQITSGTNNVLERNAGWDPDGGSAFSGTAAVVRDNAFSASHSQVAIDANGNCTTAACNPAGQEPIGYRKPTGVAW